MGRKVLTNVIKPIISIDNARKKCSFPGHRFPWEPRKSIECAGENYSKLARGYISPHEVEANPTYWKTMMNWGQSQDHEAWTFKA